MDGYRKDWNDKFGNNFTDNKGIQSDLMKYKNAETEGGYQASVSGMYGEFTIAAVLKSLPDEYVILNDILIQTGIMYRKYSIKEFNLYGDSVWDLVIRGRRDKKTGRVLYKHVDKQTAMKLIGAGHILYEEVKQSTQLDHIIVSPFGIFVIETKNHKGAVFGDVNGKVWTQVLGNGHFTFYNPVHQNAQHIKYLSNGIQISPNYMTGMIVFTNPDAWLENVNCSCCFTLGMLVEAILSYNKEIWNDKQVEKVIHRIESLNSNNYSLAKEHVKFVQDMNHRHEINKRMMMNR